MFQTRYVKFQVWAVHTKRDIHFQKIKVKKTNPLYTIRKAS